MARYSIEDTTLTALGDAIRGKVGETKEVEVPLEPYTCLINSQVDYESWQADSLGYRKKTINFQPVKGITHYKLVYSLDTRVYDDNNQIFRSANIYFRPKIGSTTTSYEFTLGDKIEAIVEAPAELDVIEVTVGALYNYFKPDEHYLKLNLTIYPCNGAGNVIETQPGYVFNSMTPIDMAEAINNMGTVPPESAFNISGSCLYKFYGGGWDWFIDLFGDKVKTDNISSCNYMFGSSKVEYIPFDLSLSNTITDFDNMFYGCNNLKELPNLTVKNKIPIPTSKYNFVSINGVFGGCQSIREIPEDYFDSIFEDGYMEARERFVLDGNTSSFNGCYSLRKVPYRIYYAVKSYGTAYYYSLYSSLHSSCYALDEVVNLPVERGPYTSNTFGSTFSNCRRLSRLTFEKNEDGTAKAVNWKSQTIDLSQLIGYSVNTSSGLKHIISYNSGITADKEVTDAASYEALKNNPDWFTRNPDYSRYNKTSAIETINSLPDVSASGGVNTIKFKGTAGSLTDGGAINTMTNEEIAVATAKGWTVSFV